MQPELDHFLNRYKEHQASLAAQPNPGEEFAKLQFQTVVTALNQASQAMVKFMGAYHPTATVDNFPTAISTPDVKEVTKAIKALEKSLKPLGSDNSDVVASIAQLNNVLSRIDFQPVYKPAINVSPTPVKVAAPNVTVAAPDLKPLTKAIEANKPEKIDLSKVVKALSEVQEQVKRIPIPGVSHTPTDPLINYAEVDIDDVDATNSLKPVRYYGYTDTRGGWYIKKLDVSGIGTTGKSIRYALGGNNTYGTNWTNRATLNYTVWGA